VIDAGVCASPDRCCSGKPGEIVFVGARHLVFKPLDVLRALGRYDAKLCHVRSDRITDLRALTDQKVPRAMKNHDRRAGSLLIATNRIEGRVTASQMAAASAASVFPRFTYGFT
jgi:hypothetical protein